MRHGERHVRLGFPEVDRAEIRSSVPCLDEARIAGEVRPTAHGIHPEAGDPEHFLAIDSQLGDLDDGRDLTRESEVVETALFQRAGGPPCRSGPADLTLDACEELFDQ